jgi:hypothetical protein
VRLTSIVGGGGAACGRIYLIAAGGGTASGNAPAHATIVKPPLPRKNADYFYAHANTRKRPQLVMLLLLLHSTRLVQ